MIKVSRQQIEQQIQLLKERVGLQQRFCHTLKERGTWERQLIKEVASNIIDGPFDLDPARVPEKRDVLNRYIAAHKAHYQAQTDAAEIALAQMKSELAIAEAMLKEAENPSVIVPGGIVQAN
jgi:hypothetical protein